MARTSIENLGLFFGTRVENKGAIGFDLLSLLFWTRAFPRLIIRTWVDGLLEYLITNSSLRPWTKSCWLRRPRLY
jgi:hypothetical protein